MGLASGATVVISQYFGAGDREGITKAVHTAVAFCLTLGAVLTVVGIFITPWSLRLLHTPEDIMPNLFVRIRGMVLSYACQNAHMRKKAKPTHMVRL